MSEDPSPALEENVSENESQGESEYGTPLDKTALPKELEYDFKEPNRLVKFVVTTNGEERVFSVHREFACKVPAFSALFDGNSTEGNVEDNTGDNTGDNTEDNTEDNSEDSMEDSTENNTEDNMEDNTESNTETYHLDNISLELCNLLMQFMYRGSCTVHQLQGWWNDWSEDNELAKTVAKEEDMKLVELWVLGDRLSYWKLQNWIFDAFDAIFHERPNCEWPFDLLRKVWELTSENCTLRPFILDKIGDYITPKMIKDEQKSLEIDSFLFDLIVYKLDADDDSSVVSEEIADGDESGNESLHSAQEE